MNINDAFESIKEDYNLCAVVEGAPEGEYLFFHPKRKTVFIRRAHGHSAPYKPDHDELISHVYGDWIVDPKKVTTEPYKESVLALSYRITETLKNYPAAFADCEDKICPQAESMFQVIENLYAMELNKNPDDKKEILAHAKGLCRDLTRSIKDEFQVDLAARVPKMVREDSQEWRDFQKIKSEYRAAQDGAEGRAGRPRG